MSHLLIGNEDLEASSTWSPPTKPAERPMLPGHEHLVDNPFADYFIKRNYDGRDDDNASGRPVPSTAERQP